MNVLIIEGFSRALGIPAGVEQDARDGKIELWNAPRPFSAHEHYTGEFMHGVFYGVIYPDRDWADDFRKDCRLILEGDSVLAQCFARTAEALKGLDDEELEALLLILPPKHRQPVRSAVELLREAKDQPASEVLAPPLDEYWNDVLKKKVQTALLNLTKTTGEQL